MGPFFSCEFSAISILIAPCLTLTMVIFFYKHFTCYIYLPSQAACFPGQQCFMEIAHGLWSQRDLDPLSLLRWGVPNILRFGGSHRSFVGQGHYLSGSFCLGLGPPTHSPGGQRWPGAHGAKSGKASQPPVLQHIPSPHVLWQVKITGKRTVTASCLSQKLKPPSSHSCPDFLLLVIPFPFTIALTGRHVC